jgi:dihydrofolate reductase
MGRLMYLTPTSLDGFIGDGDYSWGAPYAEEIMAALTVGLSDVGTYLYGRRTYETMAVWETDPTLAEQSSESAAFAAMWQAADKVVFSSTLSQVHTRRTRLDHKLDVQRVAEIKAASRGDLTIGGRRWPPKRCGWTWWTWWSCCGARSCWAVAFRCCRRVCAGI